MNQDNHPFIVFAREHGVAKSVVAQRLFAAKGGSE